MFHDDYDKKDKEREEEEKREKVSRQTIDIFSGVTGKTIEVQRCDGNENPTPQNDGSTIWYEPMVDSYYEDVEHEIAHILFDSDGLALNYFIDDWSKAVSDSLAKSDFLVNTEILSKGMFSICNLTEDVRVNSLWGRIYPGSGRLIRKGDYEAVATYREQYPTPGSIVEAFAWVSCGHDLPDDSEFKSFEPIFKESLDKVKDGMFSTTLVVSKWTIRQIVQHLIQEGVEQSAMSEGNQGQQSQQGGQQQQSQGGGQQQQQNQQSQQQEQQGQGQNQSQQQEQQGQQEQQQQGGKRKAKNEQEAMQMVEQMLRKHVQNERAELNKTPLKDRNANTREEEANSRQTANQALGQKTDDESMQEHMEQAADKANSDISDIRNKLGLSDPMSIDGWVKKDTDAQVTFVDVASNQITEVTKLNSGDRKTISRLRAIFNRELGKKRMSLNEIGSSIDVRSVIDRRVSKNDCPIFMQDNPGRGFKALVMIDQSGSMGGHKRDNAERACQILTQALDYPFVDLGIWGWTSTYASETQITRYDSACKGYRHKDYSQGGTPLHIAMEMGCRYLEIGTETKYLFMCTDGCPSYATTRGGFSQKSAVEQTADTVRNSRRKGVNVIGVLFGNDVPDSTANQMFGVRRWLRMPEKNIGTDLTRLVSTCFSNFVKSR